MALHFRNIQKSCRGWGDLIAGWEKFFFFLGGGGGGGGGGCQTECDWKISLALVIGYNFQKMLYIFL